MKPKNELNPDIIKHNQNVSTISNLICESMRISSIESRIIHTTAIYHDIGKSNVDQSILYKPGKLDQYEYEEIKKHARYGYNEMKGNTYLRNYALYVLYHHENYNGGGYYNVKSSDIPLPSRILRMADYFDALCESRPYREPLSFEEAIKVIDENKKVFDPNVYDAFLRVIESSSFSRVFGGLYENKFSVNQH